MTEEVSCQFTSETTGGTRITGWFLNGEEITFSTEPQFPGLKFSASDSRPERDIISTLKVTIVTTMSEDLLYLNDGNIVCFPPGYYGGTVFGLFRTFVTGYGQFAKLHTHCVHMLNIVCWF